MNLNDNTHLEYTQTTSIVAVNRLKFTSARYIKCFALKWSQSYGVAPTTQQRLQNNSHQQTAIYVYTVNWSIDRVHDVEEIAKYWIACQRFHNPSVHACKCKSYNITPHQDDKQFQSLWLVPALEIVPKKLCKTPKNKQYNVTLV